MKGIVITADNDMYVANFRNFPQIAEKMGWDITERVKPWGLGPAYCMLIDEEGRVPKEGKPKTPMNNFGSLMYGMLVHGCPIVGDIVIMKDQGPNIVGLDDDELDNMTRMISHVWNVTEKESVDYTK